MRLSPREKTVFDQLTEGEVALTDLSRRPVFRGWHFRDIENAARGLVNKGVVAQRVTRDGVVLRRKEAGGTEYMALSGTDMTVANTIREQIGNRVFMMLGAKNLMGDEKSLTFQIGRNAQGVTHIRVQLDPSDTYTMQFIKIGRAPGYKKTIVAEASDIYADNLRRVIESKTGMYTSL